MNKNEKKIKIPGTENLRDTGTLGYVMLFFLILMFSGLLRGIPYLEALDFTTLNGKFGAIYNGINFVGKGAQGARSGFMQGLSLIPAVMFAMGLVAYAEYYGALYAAQKMLTHIMRPLIGTPGITALPMMAGLNSSDAGAVLTRDFYDTGLINEEEKVKYITFQWPGTGAIINVFVSGAPLIIITEDIISPGVVLIIIIAFKIFGANLMRLYLAKWGKSIKNSKSAQA